MLSVLDSGANKHHDELIRLVRLWRVAEKGETSNIMKFRTASLYCIKHRIEWTSPLFRFSPQADIKSIAILL